MLTKNHNNNKQEYIEFLQSIRPGFPIHRLRLPETDRAALYLVDEMYRMGLAFDALLKQTDGKSTALLCLLCRLCFKKISDPYLLVNCL